jgi:PAS domain S-box-containing protein
MPGTNRERLYERILTCIADGVFTVDGDWQITSFNRAAERITGVPAEQAIGRKCSDVFRADICGQGCAIRKTLRTGQEIIDQPARILDRDGSSHPISISTAVLREPGGEVLGAVETFRDLSQLEQLRREINSKYVFEDIIGRSEAFRKIFTLLPDIAQSDSTVLIEGPSGSGKELIARAIHNLSHRRNHPCVVVNCGTLPPSLFESELFGYIKGAFTDAQRDKPGRIAAAEAGTVFFDEISELPLETQVKLLRLLQEREYEPLGSVEPRHANVRVVAATNKRLFELVSKERFRDDLYFRLAVVRLTVPPLRERREDIPHLVEHFITRFNARRGKHIEGVTPAVMEFFMRHDFPGNVRELENLIEYAFVLCHQRRIHMRHLPEEYQPTEPPPQELESGGWTLSPLHRAEEETIRSVLQQNRGNLGKTAQRLGISRTTLWRRLRAYDINAAEYRD